MASTAVKMLTVLRNKGIAYQFRDEFTTDAAAPMDTTPFTRTAEPGPGTMRLQQQDSVAEWRIVGGVLNLSASATAGGLPIASTVDSFARSAGLAFKHRSAQINGGGVASDNRSSPNAGWSTANNSTVSTNLSGVRWISGGIFFFVDLANSVLPTIIPYTAGAYYTISHVMRSSGSFIIIGDKLAGILARGNAAMYPAAFQFAAGRDTPSIDYMRVAQLGGPWQSDYGIATDRLAGARAANDTFTHEAANLWIDFTLTTLPSSGSATIDFRKQDALNYWQLEVTSAGAFNLNEVVAGTPATRATIASNTNADRLLCVIDGSDASIMRSRAGIGTFSVYSSVSTFTTQTSGVISSLGTGGAISDLVTWPRNITGEAKAWIDAL